MTRAVLPKYVSGSFLVSMKRNADSEMCVGAEEDGYTLDG